ncbi:hypothetical protein V7S43_007222 [Phytophthora oleae]|uniref:Uncharacterized protein n=1 Tax=Phytophthora oleae TaxID=2107226 RepID=A0ABD3FRP0_9STRA
MASKGDEVPPQLTSVSSVADARAVELALYQSDGLSESDGVMKAEKLPPVRKEGLKAPRTSSAMPRSSGGTCPESSQEPRPSVVNLVATEVATFFDVFGWLGVPMIIVFLLSAAWTFMRAAIQVHTNEVANSLMNTTEFDNGNFWLLPHPDAAIVYSSVVLLSLFGAGYTGLAVVMLFFYRGGTNYGSETISTPVLNRIETEPGKVRVRTAVPDSSGLRPFPADFAFQRILPSSGSTDPLARTACNSSGNKAIFQRISSARIRAGSGLIQWIEDGMPS